MKSSMKYTRKDFDLESAKKAGGLSGSMRIKDLLGKSYQYKYSVAFKSFANWVQGKVSFTNVVKGRVKGGTDHENIGEVVAGEIATAISAKSLSSNGTQIVTPNINFAYDAKHPSAINIVSEYMPEFHDLERECVIRDYKRRSEPMPEKPPEVIRYLKVDFNSAKPSTVTKRKDGKLQGHLNIGGNDPKNITLRKGIAKAVALNILFGNADINAKGNMGLSDRRVAALDFGHAFNNLISGSEKLGGGLMDPENGVLDYINRSKLIGFPSAADTKLWRDFKGLIPSKEFGEALVEMSKCGPEIRSGIEATKLKLRELMLQAYNIDGTVKNHSAQKRLLQSLNRLNRNVGGAEVEFVPNMSRMDTMQAIDHTLGNLEGFCEKRRSQMLDVGRTIHLQAEIDQLIKSSPDQNLSITQDMRDRSLNAKWVKTSPEEPPIQGDLNTYIAERRAQIAREQAGLPLSKKVLKEKNALQAKRRKPLGRLKRVRMDAKKITSDLLAHTPARGKPALSRLPTPQQASRPGRVSGTARSRTANPLSSNS